MFVREHFQFQPEVLSFFESIKQRYAWDAPSTVSLFYRGTDSPVPGPPFEAYLEPTERILHEHPGMRVHLQTDDQRFLDFMLPRFPQAIVIKEFPISQNGEPVHYNNTKSPHQLGLDGLAMMLLLSQNAYLVCSKSNVSDTAIYYRSSDSGVIDLQMIDQG